MIPCLTFNSNVEINLYSALSAVFFKKESAFNAEIGITIEVTASK